MIRLCECALLSFFFSCVVALEVYRADVCEIQTPTMALSITGHISRTRQRRKLQQGDNIEHEERRCPCRQYRAGEILETLLCGLFLEYDAGLS